MEDYWRVDNETKVIVTDADADYSFIFIPGGNGGKAWTFSEWLAPKSLTQNAATGCFRGVSLSLPARETAETGLVWT